MQASPIQITSLKRNTLYSSNVRKCSQPSFGSVGGDKFFQEEQKPKEGLEAIFEALKKKRINAMEDAKTNTKAFWGKKKIKIQKYMNAINEHAISLEWILRGQENAIIRMSGIVEGSNKLVAKILPDNHGDGHNGGHKVSAIELLKALNGGKPLEARITELRNARDEEMDRYEGTWNEIVKKDVAVAEVAVEKHVSVLEDMIRHRDAIITLLTGEHENYEHLVSGALDHVPHINTGEIIEGLAAGGVSNTLNSGIRVIK